MYLHSTETLHGSPDDHIVPEITSSLQDPSWYVGFRSIAGIIRDSMMVVLFVIAAAFALSMLEGALESVNTTPVNAAASYSTAYANPLHAVLGIKTVHAADAYGYKALQIQMPSKLTMEPGETKQVNLKFQNVGTSSWKQDSSRFVSVYTYGPKYRDSLFQSDDWYHKEQPARVLESVVGPGEVGTINLSLTAPSAQGDYAEVFYLAAEDTAWIPGGLFTLDIKVSSQPAETVQKKSVSVDSPTTNHQPPTVYKGSVTFISAPKIKARGGVPLLLSATVKNTGSTTWNTRILGPKKIRIASSNGSDFEHKAWQSAYVITTRTNPVAPGASDTFSFAITSPKYKGIYTASFQLSINDQQIDGAEINIPIEVTENAKNVIGAPKLKPEKLSENTQKAVITDNLFEEEPTIRVGVLIVDDETDNHVEIMSEESDMKLYDVKGNILAKVPDHTNVKAFYKGGRYYYDIGRGLEKSTYGLRFVPDEENSVLQITNFDRRVTRGYSHPDNQFRNILELRYNSYKDRTWVINELPIEYYLRGLAETSNASDQEFQKTLITVARTYAYYHWQRGTKRGKEFMTVVSSSNDQVYNGYGYEARTPNITKAVQNTKGVVVTYDGETAITPYFSRSDGRTRDWSEVWGGSVPWAKSVSVPCDKGKRLWGHGVGLSASGALCMAKDGENWIDILNYFYTGIDLERRWE